MKQKNYNHIKDGSVEAGLILLQNHPMLSLFTLEDIAFVCGCSIKNIQNTEQRALIRMRNFLVERRICNPKDIIA
jgi:hypothetical protein